MFRNTAKNARMQGGDVHTPEDIAAMSLGQLRELSDLQLSERELADVIQAIHTGGAGDEMNVPCSPDSQTQCSLCHQVDEKQCLACQGGGTRDDVMVQIQQFHIWLDWFRKYQLWANSRLESSVESPAANAGLEKT